jgi:hypothetical protein
MLVVVCGLNRFVMGSSFGVLAETGGADFDAIV